ncbi:site-specific integrase [Catalinimonas niigatensis]|uniref:site-specific integrase n=1 Tax=Catalinimonas niigatensis TaxID=1397264 RepID=UPI002665A33B|nr:site-specific integrase [Catalinimonas niigatensis]WPP48908.1 site-specific integrase [Catalinimonas niigatensis]
MRLCFWLAGSKLNGSGLAPIYAKITVQGKKPVNLSTGIFIKPESWQAGGNGFVKGNDKLAAAYNEKLVNIRAEIQGIYNDLERRGQTINAKIIKDIYTGAILSSVSLKVAMFRYIGERKKEQLTKGTIKTMEIRCKNVIKYLNWINDLDRQLVEVNVPFLSNLENYLRVEIRHSQSHVNKIIRFVKTVLHFAVRKEWIEYNPLSSYRCQKLSHKKKVYLSAYELELIKNHKFASWRLQKIAHLFLFQCYTGFAYIELMNFNQSWIRPGVDGKLWIFASRQKVEESSCRIPFFKATQEALEKLGGQIEQISNGKYNAYLKEIAVICGIEKNITSHVARKTFGNLLLDQNVSLEVVSSMYGHSSTKTTLSYYVDISEKRIANETSNINL